MEGFAALKKELVSYGEHIRKISKSFEKSVKSEISGESYGADSLYLLGERLGQPKEFLELASLGGALGGDAIVLRGYIDNAVQGIDVLGDVAVSSGVKYERADELSAKKIEAVERAMAVSWAAEGRVVDKAFADWWTPKMRNASAPLPRRNSGKYDRAPAAAAKGETDWSNMAIGRMIELVLGVDFNLLEQIKRRWGSVSGLLNAVRAQLEGESGAIAGIWSEGVASVGYRRETDVALSSLKDWGKAVDDRTLMIQSVIASVHAAQREMEGVRGSLFEIRDARDRRIRSLIDAGYGSTYTDLPIVWERMAAEREIEELKQRAEVVARRLSGDLVKATPWSAEPERYHGLLNEPGATRQLPFDPRRNPGVGGPPVGPNRVGQPQVDPPKIGDKLKSPDLKHQLTQEWQPIDQKKQPDTQQQTPGPQVNQTPENSQTPQGQQPTTSTPDVSAPTMPDYETPAMPTPWVPGTGGSGGSLGGRLGGGGRDVPVAAAGPGSGTLLGRGEFEPGSQEGGMTLAGSGVIGADNSGAGMPMMPPMMPPALGGGGGGGGGGGRPVRGGGPKLVQPEDGGGKAISGRGQGAGRAKPKIVTLETEDWTTTPRRDEQQAERPEQRRVYGA